ncbi:MAG: FtsQ-type POTRA domain-containing protein [Desulfobacteraceae bacterium]
MDYKNTKPTPKKNVKRSSHRRANGPIIRLRYVFAMLGVLCVCGLLLFAFVITYSAVTHYTGFTAKRVVVFGANRLSDSDVLRQADVKVGENIFHVNLSVVRQRLLAHSWIGSAEVTREIPDAILIKIKEHEPQAIVEMNKRYLMNTEGEIFKHYSEETDVPVKELATEGETQDISEAPQELPQGFPLITGFTAEDIQVAGRQMMKNETNPHKAVMNIIQIAKVPDCSLPLSQIKQILVDREIGLTLLTSGNIRTVKLGYGNYEEKVRRMGDVSKFLKEKAKLDEIDTLDLHNLERIVVKPASAHRTA